MNTIPLSADRKRIASPRNVNLVDEVEKYDCIEELARLFYAKKAAERKAPSASPLPQPVK